MKIAFLTIQDSRDIKRGSGTPYHLARELERQGHVVLRVCPLNPPQPLGTRALRFISKKMGYAYRTYRDWWMAKKLGQTAGRMLRGLDFDAALTNDYALAAFTPTPRPMILYTDEMFPFDYSQNAHPWLTNLAPWSVTAWQSILRGGLRRAALRIFAAQFAADEAQKYWRGETRVIPYGANIAAPAAPPQRSVEKIQSKGRLDLLFVGKDWQGKGGDTAVNAARILNQRGIKTHLHIAGVNLSALYSDSFLTFYGLLNKDNEGERAALEKLFQACDILLVPSKAEGYGLVFVEAAAYGMPSLAYAVSGTLSAAQNGMSGALLPPQAGASQFADEIQAWLGDPPRYRALCAGARRLYEQSANWQTAVSTLIAAMQEVTGEA